jgi:4-diphosphocytidyl-2-C-methyl-D-erythritol kinase
MVTFPNAKINLGLFVTERRTDGYHNLESVFYPVGWSDVLEILPTDAQSSDALTFRGTGLPIPGDEAGNLCLKAYHLLRADHDLPPVRIHLHKAVPIGAGLGGGSADGAFTLKSLNGLFSLGLSDEQLEAYARQLGSDCAFFVRNEPKFCFGKGDEFADVALSLRGKWIVLVNPGLHISTAEAYAGIRPRSAPVDLREAVQQPLATWRDVVRNDFETHLLPKYPVIAELKQQLYDAGAAYVSMTGSGSTVYGIFRDERNVAEQFPDFTTWQGRLP